MQSRATSPWPRPTPAIEAAVAEVLRSGRWWQSGGGAAEQLEDWLAGFCDVRSAVAVSSGTVGLELALTAHDLVPGSDVLVPAMTFVSSATAVLRAGLRPVPVDVDPDTLTIDPLAAAREVNERTTAIMPVHLAGQPADMDAVRGLASSHGLVIIEDAAQAIGARWNEAPCASMGHLGVLSFQASKLLPGGEGGAVVGDDEALVARVGLLANCGRERGSQAYDHQLVGTNGRMGEFQAAIVMAQTPRFEELALARESAFAEIAAACAVHGWWIQARPAGVTRHGCYMVLLRGPKHGGLRPSAAWLQATLTSKGLPVRRLYPPFYKTPALTPQYPDTHCPVTEQAAVQVVCVPHDVLLDDASVAELIVAIEQITTVWATHRGIDPAYA